MFQHTAARRRLGDGRDVHVSHYRFNTQPPEGGWMKSVVLRICRRCFNTQPPEGGWDTVFVEKGFFMECFNTQPPEGGW